MKLAHFIKPTRVFTTFAPSLLILVLTGSQATPAVSLFEDVEFESSPSRLSLGENQAVQDELLEVMRTLPPSLQSLGDNSDVMSSQLKDEDSFSELYASNAKPKKVKPKKSSTVAPKTETKRTVDPREAAIRKDEERARQAIKKNDFAEASRIFFLLLDRENNPERLLQIRFLLGRTLQQMGLHQVAAFPYYEIVRGEGKKNPKNKYVRQALERLTVAADALESDILLSYAIKLINEEDFPASNRDMLFYRRGEVRYREGNFIEAAQEFNKVKLGSTFYNRARYRLALSLVEAGQLEKAEQIFTSLISANETKGVTNKNRVNAILGKARIQYQQKLYADSIDTYREIPRDTEQWHDSIFEISWAYLLDGRFRSTLSNFHSLHSPYYEDFYQPESLLLRAIVYHYICRYDEMEKTLGIFERVYGPVQRDLKNSLETMSSAVALYREIRKIDEKFEELKKAKNRQVNVPFLVARQVLREGDVRRSMAYIRSLESERKKVDSSPATWRESRVGKYSRRVIERRLEATQVATGRLIRRHLEKIETELAGHMEQAGLIRIDMISGKKESVKKEIAGKGLDREDVDHQQDRSFYIQNGYDYWPFKGEYWLDEIGNYHYVGVKACE